MNNIQASGAPFGVFNPWVVSFQPFAYLYSTVKTDHFYVKSVNEYGRLRKFKAEQVSDMIF